MPLSFAEFNINDKKTNKTVLNKNRVSSAKGHIIIILLEKQPKIKQEF
jgi:hypothetical protein